MGRGTGTMPHPGGPRRPREVPDHAASACPSCGVTFGLLKRRHHCRACGEIRCGKCSSQKRVMPPEMCYNAPQRVCDRCAKREYIGEPQRDVSTPPSQPASVLQRELLTPVAPPQPPPVARSPVRPLDGDDDFEEVQFTDPATGNSLCFSAGPDGAVSYTVNGAPRPLVKEILYGWHPVDLIVHFPELERKVMLPDDDSMARLRSLATACGVEQRRAEGPPDGAAPAAPPPDRRSAPSVARADSGRLEMALSAALSVDEVQERSEVEAAWGGELLQHQMTLNTALMSATFRMREQMKELDGRRTAAAATGLPPPAPLPYAAVFAVPAAATGSMPSATSYVPPEFLAPPPHGGPPAANGGPPAGAASPPGAAPPPGAARPPPSPPPPPQRPPTPTRAKGAQQKQRPRKESVRRTGSRAAAVPLPAAAPLAGKAAPKEPAAGRAKESLRRSRSSGGRKAPPQACKDRQAPPAQPAAPPARRRSTRRRSASPAVRSLRPPSPGAAARAATMHRPQREDRAFRRSASAQPPRRRRPESPPARDGSGSVPSPDARRPVVDLPTQPLPAPISSVGSSSRRSLPGSVRSPVSSSRGRPPAAVSPPVVAAVSPPVVAAVSPPVVAAVIPPVAASPPAAAASDMATPDGAELDVTRATVPQAEMQLAAPPPPAVVQDRCCSGVPAAARSVGTGSVTVVDQVSVPGSARSVPVSAPAGRSSPASAPSVAPSAASAAPPPSGSRAPQSTCTGSIAMHEFTPQALNDDDRSRELCMQAFKAADSNGDGCLDADEMRAVFAELATACGMPPPSEEMADAMVADIDLDGSGTVEFDEFLPFLRGHLQLLGQDDEKRSARSRATSAGGRTAPSAGDDTLRGTCRRAFEASDSGGAGRLSRDSVQLVFASVAAACGVPAPQHGVARALFEDITGGPLGSVGFEELYPVLAGYFLTVMRERVDAALEPPSPRTIADPVRFRPYCHRAFTAADSSNRGSLSPSEMTRVFQALSVAAGLERPDDMLCGAFFKEIDADGNGTVDFNEFFFFVQSFLQQAAPGRRRRPPPRPPAAVPSLLQLCSAADYDAAREWLKSVHGSSDAAAELNAACTALQVAAPTREVWAELRRGASELALADFLSFSRAHFFHCAACRAARDSGPRSPYSVPLTGSTPGRSSLDAVLADDGKCWEWCAAAFRAADTDGDGRLDRREMMAVFADLAAGGGVPAPPESVCAQLFDDIDADGSGFIEMPEFLPFLRAHFQSQH
eukprot:TRINITY_DN1396_c0_g2_i1.p1 TRINITY_DN1396_c0_g2~~TRINITY_DN1396_c0_g2_i1.p1  ORF type:complete len:1246 (+),score=351.55 TRINITY_DN1396_c0_g2_i1:70-3807(+)